MKRIFFFTILLQCAPVIFAQNWTLKDSGAGLIVIENSSKPIKVMWRNTLWDLKDLEEKGALEGKYKGNQQFAAWIQGPETREFLNSKGKPAWMYRYKITYPDGKDFESDPEEFLPSGYSYTGIERGDNTEGVWKIEWFILTRDKTQEIHVATTLFQTTWGSSGKKDSFRVKAVNPDPDTIIQKRISLIPVLLKTEEL